LIESITVLDELYRYNHWANWQVIELCESLAGAQLDAVHPIGFGSLRNTMFHILAAEQVWYERWHSLPTRPFPLDAAGMSIDAISQRLDDVNEQRSDWLETIGPSGLERQITYKDGKGDSHTHRCKDLLIHVANHGVHHRAQALCILKTYGKTVAGGLDHLFFRLANPSSPQTVASAESFRQFGIECASGISPAVRWDGPLLQSMMTYGDWANDTLWQIISTMPAAAIDQPWTIGLGSIRKTLLHMGNVDRMWIDHWTSNAADYTPPAEELDLDVLQRKMPALRNNRDRFLASQNETSADCVLSVHAMGPELRIPLVESMIHVAIHGTHHRAQITNMMRRGGVLPPPIDYVIWLRSK